MCGLGTLSDTCGYYPSASCVGGEDQSTPACPSTCTIDNDCDLEAHCDDAACVVDLENGSACDEDSDCLSGRCRNGFCCDEGTCCALAADCPSAYATGPRCDDTETCQGHRVDATCSDFQCGSENIDDDTACGTEYVFDLCGLYASATCTGEADQDAPACATSCLEDTDCDPAGHCDGFACVYDLNNGASCDEDSDCTSAHCQNGFCCASGDCCGIAYHCPPSYSGGAVCDDPTTCQGHGNAAVCTNNQCSSQVADDDSACDTETLSKTCGWFRDLYCDGLEAQVSVPCSSTCASDFDCDAAAHCDGVCQEDQANGTACDEDSDCLSGHCQNGFCCDSGDCCALAVDCPVAVYAGAFVCDDAAACQGHGNVALCQDNVCGSTPVDDDRACDAATVSRRLRCVPAGHVRRQRRPGRAELRRLLRRGFGLRRGRLLRRDGGLRRRSRQRPALPGGPRVREFALPEWFLLHERRLLRADGGLPGELRERPDLQRPQPLPGLPLGGRVLRVILPDPERGGRLGLPRRNRGVELRLLSRCRLRRQRRADACGLRDELCGGRRLRPQRAL